MKALKYIAYAFIFFGVGEIAMRIDFWINHEGAVVKDFEKTQKPRSGANSSLLLLGDSFTKGLGVAEQDRIATRLESDEFAVVDSTHAGDNWADYVSILKKSSQNLKEGDVIVIGVNWNDVAFNKGAVDFLLKSQAGSGTNNKIGANEGKLRENRKLSGFRAAVHELYYKSKMADFLSRNTQNLLKRKGMPLPVGDFHYFRTKAYAEKRPELDHAMAFISELNAATGTRTILYLMPDFNLTNRIEYYKTFRDYFNAEKYPSVMVIDGPLAFSNASDGYYCISTHDGHPNGKAHIEMAKQIKQGL